MTSSNSVTRSWRRVYVTFNGCVSSLALISIAQGLVYLHEKGISHRYVLHAHSGLHNLIRGVLRDCSAKNIMMDANALYPDGFHPVNTKKLPDGFTPAKPRSRSGNEVHYYFIDFGLAVHVSPEAESKLVTGTDGRDRDPPELQDDKPYDPFKLDVFLIGNLLRRQFYEV